MLGSLFYLNMLIHLLAILEVLITSKSTKIAAFALYHIQQLPTYLSAVSLHKIKESRYYYGKDSPRKAAITAIIEKTLTLSVHQEKDNKWRQSTIKSITKSLPRDYVNEVLIPVLLTGNYKNNVLGNVLYEICQQDLIKRIKVKPSPPATWKRKIPKSKYYQNRLEILRPFLESPTQQVFDYIKNERERKDMKYAVKDVTIDIRMETIRSGRPYTLRLTKTQTAYEKKLKEWEEDLAFLEQVNKLEME